MLPRDKLRVGLEVSGPRAHILVLWPGPSPTVSPAEGLGAPFTGAVSLTASAG